MPEDNFVEAFAEGTSDDTPTVMPRTDGLGLLYPGRVNTVVGRRGCGKTWLAIKACIDVLEAGGRILYYDMEDSRSAWKARFETAGFDITTAVTEGRAVWVKPGDIPADAPEGITDYASGFDLVVFDVMNRLITRLGGTPDTGNAETIWLYDNVFDILAHAGVCVLVLDHPNRRGQAANADLDDMAPGGGAMKMNNASGTVIAMRAVTAFTRERVGGNVALYCLKDRSGHFEEGAAIGRLVGGVDVGDSIYMRLSIDMPDDESETDADAVALASAKSRILDLLDKRGPSAKGPLTQNMSPQQRAQWDWAISELISEGSVTENEEGRYELA
jgi:hypothetical protein